MTGAAERSVPAVWILHGQPDISATWWPTRRALLQRLHAAGAADAQVRPFNRPGYGLNPLPPADYAGNLRWLCNELDLAGLERVVLLGHSWAGGLAILAAAQDPRVVGVVLTASVGPGCLFAGDQVLGAPIFGELLAWLGLSAGRHFFRRAVRIRLRHRLHPEDLPHARATAYANLNRPIWRSFLAEQRSLLRDLTSLEAALAEITVPALVIGGRYDPVIPAHTTAALSARISRSTEVILDGGHDLNLSTSDQLADAVSAWLLSEFATSPLPPLAPQASS